LIKSKKTYMAAILERPKVVLFVVLPCADLLGGSRAIVDAGIGIVLQFLLATGADDDIIVVAGVASEALAGRRGRNVVGFGRGTVAVDAIIQVGNVASERVVHIGPASNNLHLDVVRATKTKALDEIKTQKVPPKQTGESSTNSFFVIKLDWLSAGGLATARMIVVVAMVGVSRVVAPRQWYWQWWKGRGWGRGIVQSEIDNVSLVPQKATVAAG
jgi:hypothetical protein